jgi:tRNA-Thr(GGU) m(6)t(6)A37 methyltransferase TsaA
VIKFSLKTLTQMTSQNIIFKPIGTIHTPFDGTKKIPRQGRFGENNDGKVVIFNEFSKGLKDLGTFTHAWLIFYFHEKHEALKLIQYPKGRDIPRGVFSIRSPLRPNKIGLTAVKIISVENNIIHFAGADMIDGTPLIDIKPYVPEIDCYPEAGKGWFGPEKG